MDMQTPSFFGDNDLAIGKTIAIRFHNSSGKIGKIVACFDPIGIILPL